ncbi:RNI-like protein [Rhizopus microsporus]|uniref:RNI-like protein n=1 Tax=Rhizopus microsporus TaxID=58291 RepID=A0A1X0SET1_RHIZD|nr:RNI-like protein [Rhizopus microsporus]
MSYRSAHYLGKCQQLQRLTLAACPNLTPMTLLPFAECAIEYLDLSGCKWLTASDTAIDLCSFTHLTHLTLICCDAISSDFLHRLTGALPQLQDFSITGNAVIDDDAIIPFLKTHTRIRGLFLLECAITDSTLEVIANYLPDLHNLDISFCTSLTPNGIRILVDRCQNLRLLGLKECSIARGDLPEIPYDENEPFFNTLTFIELDYMHDEQEQDESVRESYAYIQRYLNTEQVH